MYGKYLVAFVCLCLLIGGVSATVIKTTTYNETGGLNYTIITWTTDLAANGGQDATTWNATVAGVTSVEYLVVAGGGAGGSQSIGHYDPGGGGAGGVLNGTMITTNMNLTITVGGGAARMGGDNGGNSSIQNSTIKIDAKGGGRGGNYTIGTPTIGGSGGGGYTSGGAAGISGQGNAGGAGWSGHYGGGGGGAGAAASTMNGGNGTTIWGVMYGGGGAGCSRTGTAGTAGLGGGGLANINGTNGLGGGGGAGCPTGSNTGGVGGSGTVILRYLTLTPPVANFTSSMVQNLTPTIWNFNDTSTGTPTSWNWSFGDGTWSNSSTSGNVTHAFSTFGNYTINLTATNGVGSDTTTKYQRVYIQSNYTVVFFNTTGTTNWTVPENVISVDYLVVAGGGGGGRHNSGGGGGAGGLVYLSDYSMSGNYNIVVGGGGVGGNLTVGANGSMSWVSNTTSNVSVFGGGGGGTWNKGGLAGGSGGGGGGSSSVTIYNGGGGISGQGNSGGAGQKYEISYSAGGGGGKLSNGATANATGGGYGGSGIFINISGGGSYYAGGGGGGTQEGTLGYGGIGGGGNGGTRTPRVLVTGGVNNTGGGGGGGNFGVAETGGLGGSGTVILRYLTPIQPVAIFTLSNTTGVGSAIVNFTDTGTNSPTGWNWSYTNITGNGTEIWFSVIQNPTYTLGVGNWSIRLNASNIAGYNVSGHNLSFVNVTQQAPVANFTLSNTTGMGSAIVNFTDTSINNPTSWNWSYTNITGNGTEIWFSVIQNPTYTLGVGNWSIRLNASNIAGYNVSGHNLSFVNVKQAPVANFTSNVTVEEITYPIQFNDTSLNSPTSWNWSFGDGNYSTSQNPVYIYVIPGIYTVNLTATNPTGSDTISKIDYMNITVMKPVANFTVSNSSGNSPLPVMFNDTSLNTPTGWNWSFGDGNYSSLQNVSYMYNTFGNYSVTLIVYNGGGIDIFTSYIEVFGYSPATTFVANNTYGAIPLSVNFTDQTVNSPTSWNWSFGDGSYSDNRHPTHTYTSVGIYNVTLNTSNVWGYNVMTRTYYITAINPISVVDFAANATAGVNPLVIQFTDLSTNVPTGWNWSFGDGTYSVAANPIHAYTSVGSYTVSLTVVNAGGSNFTTKSNYIHLITTPFPLTNFVGSPTNGVSPVTVAFTDLTSGSGITGWNWSFGDGTYSNFQNPSHSYSTTGQYTVGLTATNGYGSNTTVRVNYINVNYPTGYIYPAFVASPTTGDYPLTVTFTDTSVCNPACTAWAWDFNNDGSTDSIYQNPSYTYTSPGIYSPKLIASNGAGSGTKIMSSYITVTPLYVPTTIPAPTVSWTPGYSDENGSFIYRGADMSTDVVNSTYLKYWLPNFTSSGNFSVYGFGFSIMAPVMHVFGFWIYLIIWALYMFAVWVRTQDVTMPLIIGILSIGVMGILFPVEALPVMIIMFAISFAVILVKLLNDQV